MGSEAVFSRVDGLRGRLLQCRWAQRLSTPEQMGSKAVYFRVYGLNSRLLLIRWTQRPSTPEQMGSKSTPVGKQGQRMPTPEGRQSQRSSTSEQLGSETSTPDFFTKEKKAPSPSMQVGPNFISSTVDDSQSIQRRTYPPELMRSEVIYPISQR